MQVEKQKENWARKNALNTSMEANTGHRCHTEVGDSGPQARHLVFVKWSKIQALFSPRHSKDKASGKSWALLKQRDKVALLRSKKTSLFTHAQEDFLGVKKEGGSIPQ